MAMAQDSTFSATWTISGVQSHWTRLRPWKHSRRLFALCREYSGIEWFVPYFVATDSPGWDRQLNSSYSRSYTGMRTKYRWFEIKTKIIWFNLILILFHFKDFSFFSSILNWFGWKWMELHICIDYDPCSSFLVHKQQYP
jgi:hypothetical protein